MALRRMPNGEYVDLPDDITPEGFKKVMARYKAKPSTGKPAAKPVTKKPETWGDKLTAATEAGRRFMEPLDAFNASAVHGITLGLDDVVGPAMLASTKGVANAVRKGDIGEVGRTYSEARSDGRHAREDLSDRNKVSSTVGAIAGILANPVGAETGAAKLATKAGDLATKYIPASAGVVKKARDLAATAKASDVGQIVAKAGNSMIGTGARAGANQGFITGMADTGNLEDALNEAGIGALFGGGATAALQGVGHLARTAARQGPKKANEVAMERIAAMLERSEDPLTGKPFDARAVQREIKATDAGGGDAMLADLTPEAQGWASYLAKQPGNKGASHAVNRATERAAGAADRFDARVRKQLGIKTESDDAYDTLKAIKSDRKDAGTRDYTDEVMDRQLAWNDELEELFKRANPAIEDALPGARKLVRIDGGDVDQLAFSKPDDPKSSTMVKRPSVRTMQYITQSLDGIVGKAMKDGDANLARMYSKLNRELKDGIAKANPEFAAANATQRDFFERQHSVELGESVLKRLRAGDGRKLLDDIKHGKVKPDDLKVGFADALLHLRSKSGGENPVVLMRKMMRDKDQRGVLAQLFNGHKNLAEFEKFMRRELRSADTDAMVSSGRQMQQNLLKDPGQSGNVETLADMGKSGLQGAAFGGPTGAVSRLLSSVGKWSQMLSPHAKAELSRLLSGKGEGLEEGLKKLRREALRNQANARKAAIATGKATSVAVGGYSEQ